MKNTARNTTALMLAVGLSFAGADAHAILGAPAPATATVNSSLVFDDQGIATFAQNIGPGYTDFNAQYTFTTGATSGGATSISSFNGSYFSTGFTSFSLIDVTNGNSVVTTGSVGPSFASQLGFSGLNSNTIYGLNLTGTVTNPGAGGFFVGSIAVNPVPEPGEYLLMLFGFGLVGFVAMKRKPQGGFVAA